MNYTLRQVVAFQFLASKRVASELIDDISTGALASRGDPKKLRAIIRSIERDL